MKSLEQSTASKWQQSHNLLVFVKPRKMEGFLSQGFFFPNNNPGFHFWEAGCEPLLVTEWSVDIFLWLLLLQNSIRCWQEEQVLLPIIFAFCFVKIQTFLGKHNCHHVHKAYKQGRVLKLRKQSTHILWMVCLPFCHISCTSLNILA